MAELALCPWGPRARETSMHVLPSISLRGAWPSTGLASGTNCRPGRERETGKCWPPMRAFLWHVEDSTAVCSRLINLQSGPP